MAELNDRLAETRAAFDSVAAVYHQTNVDNPILAAMRERMIAAIHRWVPAGAHVLDLGCGPGTDTVRLAADGYRVTAIDPSPAMLAEAFRRVELAGVLDRVELRPLGAHELTRLPRAAFDAVCADFGPLNCVLDLDAAAGALAVCLRPGGVIVASVIGRVCPWEILRHLVERDWPRIRIRYASKMVAVPLNGRRVWTRYYTPRELAQILGHAGFTRVALRTLGLLTPPPYLEAFARRHPRLMATLQQLEDAIAGWPVLRACGDHFLIVLRRR